MQDGSKVLGADKWQVVALWHRWLSQATREGVGGGGRRDHMVYDIHRLAVSPPVAKLAARSLSLSLSLSMPSFTRTHTHTRKRTTLKLHQSHLLPCCSHVIETAFCQHFLKFLSAYIYIYIYRHTHTHIYIDVMYRLVRDRVLACVCVCVCDVCVCVCVCVWCVHGCCKLFLARVPLRFVLLQPRAAALQVMQVSDDSAVILINDWEFSSYNAYILLYFIFSNEQSAWKSIYYWLWRNIQTLIFG